MIQEFEGDLLTVTEGIICHQVNCYGMMGLGIAAQIKHKWPEVYREYHRKCMTKSTEDLAGTVMFYPVGLGLYVANMFSQIGYGTDAMYTKYDLLEKCLKDVCDNAFTNQLNVYVPYGLACGYAGGSWGTVSKILEKVFGNSLVDVGIYRLPEGDPRVSKPVGIERWD